MVNKLPAVFFIALFTLLSPVNSIAANLLVTAVRDSGGDLKMISWDVASRERVTRLSDALAGSVSAISTAPLYQSYGSRRQRMATAVRDSRDNLKIIIWDTSEDGRIFRLGSASAGRVSAISATAYSKNHLVTAVRDSAGNLKIILWQISDDGAVTRLGDASAGAVSLVSADFVGSGLPLRLITAVRDSVGNLKIISWNIGLDGRISRRSDISAGAVSEISAFGLGETLFVTAVRESHGNLKVIVWNLDPDSGRLTRLGDASAGAATKISAFGLNGPNFATAVRTVRGNLKVIAWHFDLPTGKVRRLADATAGGVSLISGKSIMNDRFQTAVRDSGGNLKIITWTFIPTPGREAIRRQGDGAAGAVSLIATESFIFF